MKKHFAKLLLLGAMIVAGFSFVACNDIEKEMAELDQKIENLESATAKNLQDAINALNAKLASDYALKTDVSALEIALKGSIAEQVAAVETKINKAIDDAIAACKAENAAAVAKVAGDLAKVSEELDSIAAEVAAATSKIDENAAAIAGVDAKALELKATIDSLSEYLEGIEAMVKENNATLLSLAEHLEAREAEVDMKLTELNGSLVALSAYLEELEASINARFAEHANTFASLSIFLEQHEIETDAKFAEILATLESLSPVVEQMSAQIKENNATLESLAPVIETLEAKVNEVRNTLESLAPVIETMQAQIAENNATLVSLSEFLAEADYQGQIDSLKADIASHLAMLRELETTVYFSLADHLEGLEAQLAALAKKDVDVDKVLEEYKKEIEAIKEALGKVGEQVGIIANQIQSIVYVPEYNSGMQAYMYNVPTGKKSDDNVFVLVEGTFEVSPKHLAAKISSKNAFFSAVKTKTKAANAAELFEAKVVSTDATTGRVVAYAYVPATELDTDNIDVYNQLVAGNSVALSFGVADASLVQQIGTTDMIDLGSYASSSYANVEYISSKDATTLIKFYDGEDTLTEIKAMDNTHNVAFSTAVANSERALFEDYSYRIVLPNEDIITLEEAAELFNTPLAITYGEGNDPVYNPSGDNGAKKYIAVTGKDFTATANLKIAATSSQVGNYASLLVDEIYLNEDKTSLEANAVYKISNNNASDVVLVEGVSKNWAYGSYSKEVDGVSYHKSFTVAELDVTGISNIENLGGTITLTTTDRKYAATITKVASQIVSAEVPELPFGATYEFVTTKAYNKVDYPISFSVTIGEEPKDATIDLGTLSAVVSNVSTVVNNNFVGTALDKHSSYYNGVKFGQVYTNFAGTVTIKNQDGELYTGSGSVTFAAAPKTDSAGKPIGSDNKEATDVKNYIEASTITIAQFAKGTYDVEYVVNAYGVKYTYVAEIEVVEPQYGLSTVPQFVKDGVVTVSGVTTMPEIKYNSTSKKYELTADASFESHSINLKDYFQVDGVAKEYAGDVKVVYTVKALADDFTPAPLWDPEFDSIEIPKGTAFASVSSPVVTVSTDNGKVLGTSSVTWNNEIMPYSGLPMGAYTTANQIEVTAYLVKAADADPSKTDAQLADVAYDKETITIVQKDRISSFTQLANTGKVTYKNGLNQVNIMKFIETKDFNGYLISNSIATNVTDYFYTPTGNAAEVFDADIFNLYHTQIVLGEPVCDLLTAEVSIDAEGTLSFTNNSADLLSDVVVTIPVYLTYDYDNFGANAKKVDVKVTFSPAADDDTTTEGDDTTTGGDDTTTGGKTDSDYVDDDAMLVP